MLLRYGNSLTGMWYQQGFNNNLLSGKKPESYKHFFGFFHLINVKPDGNPQKNK